MDGKKEIAFNCINIIDFWIVDFTLIMIKDTSEEKYISWIKHNFNDYLYKHLHTTTFMMILKYCILLIEIPYREVY